MMKGIAVNRNGEVLPVLEPITSESFLIDGSIAHAESVILDEGIYRLSVRTSTDDAGVMISIGASASATTSTGMFLAHNNAEYFFISEGQRISVIDGIVNVTRFM